MSNKDFLPSNIKYDPNADAFIEANAIILPENDTLDIAGINLLQLVSTLKKYLNKRPSIFLFMRERQNKKIALTNEMIKLVIEQVDQLRTLGKNLTELKADAIFSNELLNMLAHERREEFKMAFVRKIADHELYMHGHKHEMAKKDLEIERAKHEMRMEELRTKADVAIIEAKAKEQNERAFLLGQLFALLEKMPAVLVSHTLTAIFGSNNIDFSNPVFDEQIKNFVTKKYEEEARKMKIENDELQRKHDENKI